MTPPKEDKLDILNIRKMKNEHFDKDHRDELRALKDEKRKEKDAQKHVYDAAETSFNEYRDSHTGQVQPLLNAMGPGEVGLWILEENKRVESGPLLGYQKFTGHQMILNPLCFFIDSLYCIVRIM